MTKENKKTPKNIVNDLALVIKESFKKQEKRTDDKIKGFSIMIKQGFDEIDNLAIIVKKSFDEVNGRIDNLENKMNEKFDKVDKKFIVVEDKLDHTNTRIDYLTKDIKEIKEQIFPKVEIEDLSEMVKYVEEKLGIESGK